LALKRLRKYLQAFKQVLSNEFERKEGKPHEGTNFLRTRNILEKIMTLLFMRAIIFFLPLGKSQANIDGRLISILIPATFALYLIRLSASPQQLKS